ncbi:DNA polymerase zeta [Mycoemilia scoparia]|uniref:DNA polymerase zeta n=1 Tax=Mycoemilia scoparia TaxID=417184 RepID=A0A9W7ZZX2_9FUNG|nr:DNA polymerase zeta [Mycoemilia scoparia]
MLGNLGTFRLQIVDIDYYLAAPGILDKPLLWPYNVLESSATQVPVIRIFGNTESQQSACLHIHQAWPYIYVPYNGKPDYDACIKYGHGLGISLNEALNVAQSKKYGAHISDDHQTLVLGVIPVKAISVYGYYDEYDPFFKIVLANPGHITLAACLLTSGAVLGTKTQVFEAHIPYLLHFMIDHNLYGMNYIELDSIKFRQGLPDKVLEKAHFENHLPWTESSVPDYMRWVPKGIPEFLLKPSPPERMTSCSLEADALGRDVLNANKIKERRLGSHKIKPSKEDRPDKYVPSLGQIWKDIKSMDTENEMSDVFSANNNSNSPQSREIHENKDALNALEMGAILKKALEIDRSKPKSNKGAGNDRSWFDSFPTAFGALSSLYPQAWAGGGLYQEFMKSGTTQVMNDVDARDFSGPRLPRLLRSETTIDESIVMGIVNENSEENDDLEEDELDGLWLERENDGMESGRHTESGSAYGTIISPKSNKTNKQIGNVKEANIPQFDGPGDLVPNNEGHINSTAFKRQKKSHRMPRDFLDNSHKVEEDANVVAGIYESNARVPFSFNIKEMWSPKPNSAQEGTAIADNLNPNRSELPSLLESPSAPKRVQVSRKASRIAVRDPCPQKAEIKHVDHGLNKLLAQAETATTSTQDKSPKDDSMPSMKSGTCASDNHEESHQVYRTSQPIETDHLICPDDNVVYTIDIGIPSNSFVYGESAPDVDTLLNSLPSHAPRQPSESQDNLKPFNPNLDTGRIHNDSKLVNVKGIKENCGFNIIASKVDATTDALKIESKDIQRRLAWWKIDNELAINRRSFSSSGRLTSLWKGMLWEPSIMPPLYHDAERWLELENKSSTDKGEIINVADLEPKKISTPVTQRMKQLHRRPQFLKLPSLKSQDTMTYEASQIIGITPKKPFMAIQYPNIDLQTPNSRTSLNMHKRKGCYFSYISMELHAEPRKIEYDLEASQVSVAHACLQFWIGKP